MATDADEPVMQRVMGHVLPIALYYALFHGTRAAILASGAPDPDSHASLRKDYALNRARFLPEPWCFLMSGDPEAFEDCDTEPRSTRPSDPFNPMEQFHPPESYVWATLRMTRRWTLADARQEFLKKAKTKAGKPRKNLPHGQRVALASATRSTSLLDFLYELRCRANYDSLDEYLNADDRTIERAHQALAFLLASGMLIAEAQIAKSVGSAVLRAEFEAWAPTVEAYGELAARGPGRRLALIEAEIG
jgi:hypothetical protein